MDVLGNKILKCTNLMMKRTYMSQLNRLLRCLQLVVGKLDQGSFVMYFHTMKLSTSLNFPRMRAACKWGLSGEVLSTGFWARLKVKTRLWEKVQCCQYLYPGRHNIICPKASQQHLTWLPAHEGLLLWPKSLSKTPYQYMITHLQAALFLGKPCLVL